jgi:hypothetical protein
MVSKLLAVAGLALVYWMYKVRDLPVQTNNTRERSTGRSILDGVVSTGSRGLQRQNLLMIQECVVLLRVEHLEERAGRVAIYPLANLVNFINEDQWVFDANALECLDNLSRKGSAGTQMLMRCSSTEWTPNTPDVSPPMTLDFGDIGQTSN